MSPDVLLVVEYNIGEIGQVRYNLAPKIEDLDNCWSLARPSRRRAWFRPSGAPSGRRAGRWAGDARPRGEARPPASCLRLPRWRR